MTKVLITGGFGLVGGRLALHLESQGFDVILGSRRAREPFRGLRRARSVITDWSNDESLEEACRNIDVVVHCAGLDAQACARTPEMAERVNVGNSLKLAEIASASKVSKFLYLSTVHVYDAQLRGHVHEDSPLKNSHPYAASKAEAERKLLNLSRKSEMDTIITRLANSFGVPVADANPWPLVVNDLCRQAAFNGAVAPTSQSDVSRNFVSLRDVCVALELVMGQPRPAPVFNIGDRTLRISELCGLIRRRYQLASQQIIAIVTRFEAHPSTEPEFILDISRLRNAGHNPTSFEKELDELIAFCLSEYGKSPKST